MNSKNIRSIEIEKLEKEVKESRIVIFGLMVGLIFFVLFSTHLLRASYNNEEKIDLDTFNEVSEYVHSNQNLNYKTIQEKFNIKLRRLRGVNNIFIIHCSIDSTSFDNYGAFLILETDERGNIVNKYTNYGR